MIKPLDMPHIPKGKVCLCAIGAGQPYIKKTLEGLGIAVLECAPNKELSEPTQTHADLLLHHLGGERVLLAQEDTLLKEQLIHRGFSVSTISKPLQTKYPQDTALNCFRLQNKLFGKIEYLALELLNHYQFQGGEMVNLSQGYAKCTTCIVDEQSIITSDATTAKIAKQHDIQVLLISPGDISLPGYNYGFIGGCSGLLDKGTLVFCGEIRTHRDHEAIEAFCAQRNVQIHSLITGPLIDIGGILPLLEEWAY